ncbi:MAG: hypothetical protein WEB00_10345 [Dehalococcoidia bacterium]
MQDELSGDLNPSPDSEGAAPDQATLLAEYAAANGDLVNGPTRLLQAAATVVAAMVSSALVLSSVLPDDYFPSALKVVSIWLAAGAVLTAIGFSLFILHMERIVRVAAVDRMIEIEWRLGMRRLITTSILMSWTWRSELVHWQRLSRPEKELLEARVKDGELIRRPAGVPRVAYAYARRDGQEPRLLAGILTGLLTVALASYLTVVVLSE